MHIHCLQHVPFEDAAHIGHWARCQGHTLTTTALYQGEPLPQDVAQYQLMVVMGGPMGVHDTLAYPWMTPEKHFIAQCLEKNTPLLGICLGAQLIADVLGAKVYPNAHKEIGWHPVKRMATAADTLMAPILPAEFIPFHWHGDTFDLPAGAVHLVQSDACPHQAFFYPPATLGLQFHLESTDESIDRLIRNCGDELIPAPYVQTDPEIKSHEKYIGPSNVLMEAILTHFER